MNPKDISKQIKKLLIDKEITPNQVAVAIGTYKSRISDHCNINPMTGDFWRKTPHIRKRIAETLGVSYASLWHESPVNTSK